MTTTDAAERFEAYLAFLLERNAAFNLTAIREPAEIRVKHFEDSLTILPWLEGARSLADIGSGAGFPGVPAAILRPDLEVTLIEATGKKADFLEALLERLGLSNAKVWRGRAEAAGRDPGLRGRFDRAAARAVAGLPTLVEYALPLLARGGLFLAMKGPSLDDAQAASPALRRIGGTLEEIRPLTLSDGSARHMVVVRKTAETERTFPRRDGVPAKDPILK